jgi:hypothetical protein
MMMPVRPRVSIAAWRQRRRSTPWPARVGPLQSSIRIVATTFRWKCGSRRID